MSLWKETVRCSAVGFILGPLPFLLVWPENLRQVLVVVTLGVVQMFVAAHQNGHLLPSRPVVATALYLLVVGVPMALASYALTRYGITPTNESLFRLAVILLAATAAAVPLALARRRAGEHSRLARTLRPFDRPKLRGCAK